MQMTGEEYSIKTYKINNFQRCIGIYYNWFVYFKTIHLHLYTEL